MNTHLDLSPSWLLSLGEQKAWGRKRTWRWKKGMALGKGGMARRHAKRGWGKH